MDGRGDAGRGGAQRRRFALVPARARDGEGGFTLIELVVAISIFAITSSAIVATISSGLNLTRNNRNRAVAANLASQRMDELRAMSFTDFQAQQGHHQSTVTVPNPGGTPYTVDTTVNPVPVNSDSSPCDADAGATNDLVFRVDVAVSWPAMRGATAADAHTVISPPVGVYDQSGLGFLGVKVLGADGKGVANVPVTLSPGATPANNSTDPSGCAFFTGAAAGSYTVALGTPTDAPAGSVWVDRQGNPSPTQTVGVTANAITQVGFDDAQAATMNVTLAGDGGATVPSNVPVTLGDTDFQPNGTRSFTGTGTTQSIANLFPTTAGYTAWAGDCADADPQGASAGGPYWPGPQPDGPAGQRSAPVAVTPGQPAAASITLPAVSVTVQRSGVALQGVDVVAVHGSDNGCPAGESYDLGPTDATGIVTAALPYGTYTLQVTGYTASGSPAAVLDPTGATSTPSVTVAVQ